VGAALRVVLRILMGDAAFEARVKEGRQVRRRVCYAARVNAARPPCSAELPELLGGDAEGAPRSRSLQGMDPPGREKEGTWEIILTREPLRWSKPPRPRFPRETREPWTRNDLMRASRNPPGIADVSDTAVFLQIVALVDFTRRSLPVTDRGTPLSGRRRGQPGGGARGWAEGPPRAGEGWDASCHAPRTA